MEDNQQEFISWLATKLQVQDEKQLQSKLEELGEDGIKKAYEQFISETGDAPAYAMGGKLDYIKCLEAFKKGGSIGCGCSGMKVKEKGGKLKMKKCPNCGKVNCTCKKKYQEGGQVTASSILPTPAITPNQKVVTPSQEKFYRMIQGQYKAPLDPQANVRQIDGKFYDYTGMEGLDYDFTNKKFNTNPEWFNTKLKEKGAVGLGHTDINQYNQWINSNQMPAPSQVFPNYETPAKIKPTGNATFHVGASGSGSGFQPSPQNAQNQVIQAQKYKQQSQMAKSYQQGGQMQLQAKPQGAPGQQMQQMTPEQMADQKVDKKVMEITGKKEALKNPESAGQTPLDKLRTLMNNKLIKVKPEPKIKLRSLDDRLYGSGEVVK